MQNATRRFMAIILSLIMMLTVVPMAVFADEDALPNKLEMQDISDLTGDMDGEEQGHDVIPDGEDLSDNSGNPENSDKSDVYQASVNTITVAEIDVLADNILWQSYELGIVMSLAELILPDILTGEDSDGNLITIESVTWESDIAFDPEVGDIWYYFLPVLPENYELAADVAAPVISVFIESENVAQIMPMARTMAVFSATSFSATPISSITYDFTIGGVNGETSLDFTATTLAWENLARTINLEGNGDYSITVSPTWSPEVLGLKNLGFVNPIEGSSITVRVNKITINSEYELTYENPPVLLAANDSDNGLENIWNTNVGEPICSNESAYLALNEAEDSIEFYTEQEVTVVDKLTTIESIKYDFSITNVSGETSLNFSNQTTSWASFSDVITLNGNGDYSVTLYPQADGFTNLGFFDEISGSSIEVELTKITVNDTYEMTFDQNPIAYVGTSYSNGFWNIWNTGIDDGTKLCSGDGYYISFMYNKEIAFYVETESTGKSGLTTDRSQDYVNAMGHGWNLGNSFDGFDADLTKEDAGETAWGNPVITRELIAAVKEKGFDSIRIPWTVHRRYTVNANASDGEYKYIINPEWLARYKEVVDWAVDEDLYVMINLHHDSWIWLSSWDGNTSSEEYRMYMDFWQQLVEYFADQPDSVCFETINEPAFEATGAISAQKKLDMINRVAMEIVRGVAGNENRMIVLPTMHTNHGESEPLVDLISELKDENVIATVHYYSEWVYSANLGKTGFDEVLWGEDYTPRVAADEAMGIVYDKFTSQKIGVVIGEYGLLGYDASDDCLQTGEELKYYEYMSELSRQLGICLMFWDNGSGINRTETANYSWKQSLVGKMLEASITGRSSYATDLDSIYIAEEVSEDIIIPLTLNGNSFVSIVGLTQGTDYTYDDAAKAIVLKKDFVNGKFRTMENSYGVFASLVLKFSSGADWVEYLIKYSVPEVLEGNGTTTSGISIPVNFNGSKVRRITAYQESGKVGPHSGWWSYLQYDGAFSVDYTNGQLIFKSDFFQDSSVNNGLIEAVIEFYDGQFVSVWMDVDGNVVTSIPTHYSVTIINGKGSGYYTEGETVSVSAYASPSGQRFSKWTATGLTGVNLNSNPLTFTMPANNVSLTATYVSNSNSQSSSNNSSSSTPAQTVIPAAGNQVQVSYTKSGSEISLALPTDKVKEIISKSTDKVVLDLSGVKKSTMVTISKSALTEFVKARLGLEIKLPEGSIVLNNEALASVTKQAGGNNVSVEMKQLSVSDLKAEQRNAVRGSEVIVDINIFSDLKKITTFDGSLTVSVPYSGSLPAAVWYLNDTGELEKIDCVYDAKTKTVSFTVQHLSIYVVGLDTEDNVIEPTWVNPFVDVQTSDWFYKSVEYAMTNDLFSGTSTNTFSPNTQVTREMMVSILWSMENSPEESDTNFSDVPLDAYYALAVAWAAESGIVSGVGDNRFAPELQITRQEMAVMLYNYANYKRINVQQIEEVNYADINQIGTWARAAVKSLSESGILSGKGSNNFDPQGKATRAEVATMLMYFLEAGK